MGEGERLPADGVLLSGVALTVDESALTGEAVAVTKRPLGPEEVAVDEEPGGEGTPWLVSGSLIPRAQGVVGVPRTGAATRLGRIDMSLAAITPEPTLLQRTTARLIGWLGLLAFGLCLLLDVTYGLLRGDWIKGAWAGVTLAIALLPEEFPTVLAIFLALGAGRLARRNVLTRRPAVIETLGATTLLCGGKTGTLTENRMRLASIWCEEGEWPVTADQAVPGPFSAILHMAARASSPKPVDSMDRAVHAAAREVGQAEAPLATHPVRPDRLAFVQAWPEEDRVVLAANGAP